MKILCNYCQNVSFPEIEEVNNETKRYFLVTVRCEYCAKLQRHKQFKPRKITDSIQQNQSEELKNETI